MPMPLTDFYSHFELDEMISFTWDLPSLGTVIYILSVYVYYCLINFINHLYLVIKDCRICVNSCYLVCLVQLCRLY